MNKEKEKGDAIMGHHRRSIRRVPRGITKSFSELVAIRWFGAYNGWDIDLSAKVEFEAAPSRMVAAEILHQEESNLYRSRVGLLIDTSSTRLYRAYAGDSWTEPGRNYGYRLIATDETRIIVRTWSEAAWLVSMFEQRARLEETFRQLDKNWHDDMTRKELNRYYGAKKRLEEVEKKIGSSKESKYIEATIDRPRYLAVMLRQGASSEARKAAEMLSEKLNIPIVEFRNGGVLRKVAIKTIRAFQNNS